MDYLAFYAGLKRGEIRTVYLFEGEEEYSKESALKALRAALMTGPLPVMNEATLSNPEESQVVAACETLPMLQERRLVVVRDSPLLTGKPPAGEGGDEDAPAEKPLSGDGLTAYVGRVPPSACLVFFVRGKANGARKLYRAVRDLGGVVGFDALEPETLVKWIAKELKSYGKQVDRQTAERLAFACGRELMPLKNEIAKIAAVMGERAAVAWEDIEAVATLSAEYRVFDLADKVSAGDAGRALPLMRDMLAGGEQRLMLLALLQRHYRQLLFARILTKNGRTQAEVARELGVPGFAARRLATAAGAYTLPQLRRAYLKCVDQEFWVKSGRLNEEGSLEQLVMWLLALKAEGAKA